MAWNDELNPYVVKEGSESPIAALLNDNWDGTITVHISEEITEPGTYRLIIPAGAITVGEEECPELSFLYTIKGEDYTIDPAPGEVSELSQITMSFNNYMVSIVDGADKPFLFNTETGEEVAASMWFEIGGKTVMIMFPIVNTPGEWALIIPDGSLQKTIDDSFLPEMEFIYTITTPVGIDSVKAAMAKGKEVYNLQGQKMSQVSKPGLYIVDGKKLFVK